MRDFSQAVEALNALPLSKLTVKLRQFNLDYIGIRSESPLSPLLAATCELEPVTILESADLQAIWMEWETAQEGPSPENRIESAARLQARIQFATNRLANLQAGYDRLLSACNEQVDMLSALLPSMDCPDQQRLVQERLFLFKEEIAQLIDARDVYIPGLLAGLASAEAMLARWMEAAEE